MMDILKAKQIAEQAKASLEGLPDEWVSSGSWVYSEEGLMVCEMSEPHANDYVQHKALGLGAKKDEWILAMKMRDFIVESRQNIPALANAVLKLIEENRKLGAKVALLREANKKARR